MVLEKGVSHIQEQNSAAEKKEQVLCCGNQMSLASIETTILFWDRSNQQCKLLGKRYAERMLNGEKTSKYRTI